MRLICTNNHNANKHNVRNHKPDMESYFWSEVSGKRKTSLKPMILSQLKWLLQITSKKLREYLLEWTFNHHIWWLEHIKVPFPSSKWSHNPVWLISYIWHSISTNTLVLLRKNYLRLLSLLDNFFTILSIFKPHVNLLNSNAKGLWKINGKLYDNPKYKILMSYNTEQ